MRSPRLIQVLTAGLSLTIMAVMPRTADLSPGWQTPIVALELAQSEEDVGFLAGDGAADARAAVDRGHAFDMVFPFAYAALLLLTLLGSNPRPWLRATGVAAAVITVAGDLWENAVLLELTARLGRAEPVADLFGTLAAATWTKWLAIALLVALIAAARWRGARKRAVLCLPVVVLTPVAAVVRTPLTGEAMALAVVVTIASFVIGALVDLRRPAGDYSSSP
jgi:hypothetical protein